jgi:hypothetical protein
MRCPAEPDDVADGELDLGGRLLFDEGEPARQIAPWHLRNIATVERDDAARRVAQPAKEPEQARFAGAVRADQPQHAPRRRFERHAIDDHPPAGAPADIPACKRHAGVRAR